MSQTTNDSFAEFLTQMGFSDDLISDGEEAAREVTVDATQQVQAILLGDDLPQNAVDSFIAEVGNFFDALGNPANDNIWESKITGLQSQARACLTTELMNNMLECSDEGMFAPLAPEEERVIAIAFPITLGMIAKNRFVGTEIKDNSALFTPDMLEHISPEELLRKIMMEALGLPKQDLLHNCSDVHPHVKEAVEANQDHALSPFMDKLSDLVSTEVLNHVWMIQMPEAFRSSIMAIDVLAFAKKLAVLGFRVAERVDAQF